MAISVNPYLNFPGNTREAMEHYQSIFGGELQVMTFGDAGVTEMPAEGIMHAALVHPDFTIMASDAMPGAEETWGGTRNYIAFMGDEVAVLSNWFDKLADGGTVGRPLKKEIWGDIYGNVKDKFGIEWMVNISENTGSDLPS